MDMNRVRKHNLNTWRNLGFQAKATLGFSPSINIDDITDEKLHAKFVQKLEEVNTILYKADFQKCFVKKIKP